jgi:hypothetical protein
MFKGNSVTFWKILAVGICIPAITPLFVSIYLAWMPGSKVGSVDGWLGYLGGYSGGFLAFISAYFIYRSDQKTRNKTMLNVRTGETTEDEVLSATYHIYFVGGEPKNVKLEKDTGRVQGVEDYPVIKTLIKNISPNYSKSINLYIKVGSQKYDPRIFIKGQDLFSKFDSMSELESQEVFEFILHIDPTIWANSGCLECELSSSNLQGEVNVQKVDLHKGSSGGLTFEQKT